MSNQLQTAAPNNSNYWVANQPAKAVVAVNTDSIKLDSIAKATKDLPYYQAYKQVQYPCFQQYNKQYHSAEYNNQKVFASYNSIESAKPNISVVKPFLSGIQGGFINTMLFMLLAGVVILSWVKVSFAKYVTQIFGSIFNYHDSYKLFRDHNSLVGRVYFLLNFIFVLSVSIFFYHIFKYFGVTFKVDNTYFLLGICMGFILVYYLFRHFATNFYSYVFNMQNAFSEYLHNSFIFYKVTGLFILPLSAVAVFATDEVRLILIYMGIGVSAILYIISILRGTRIMLQKGVLLFYWILYLCTLEILPLLLIYKFITRFV